MQKLKFLHFADLHLDMPFKSLGSRDSISRTRRNDLKAVLSDIIDIAKENKTDIILISGDIYENNFVKKSTINYLNDKFSSVPDIPIFIIPGNHDPYIQKSFYVDFNWPPNVHILTESNPSVIIEELGVRVCGVGFSSFAMKDSDMSELAAENDELINILMFHGTVDLDLGSDDYNKTTSEKLSGLGMDYIALGHFHARKENIGGHANINYPGSPEPLGFDEEGEHGVFLGTIKKDGEKSDLDITFVKTMRKFYKTLDVNVKSLNTDEKAIEIIRKTLNESVAKTNEDLMDGLFKIVLKGTCEAGFKPHQETIESAFSNETFFLKFRDETRIDFNIGELLKDPGLKGLFTRKMMDKIDNSETDVEKEMLRKAMYYGLDALHRGEVEI